MRSWSGQGSSSREGKLPYDAIAIASALKLAELAELQTQFVLAVFAPIK